MQLNGFQMQHRKQRLQLTQLILECNTDTMQQANEKQYQWMQDIQDSTFSVMPPKGTCNRQAKGCIKAMEASCCKGAMQCALKPGGGGGVEMALKGGRAAGPS